MKYIYIILLASCLSIVATAQTASLSGNIRYVNIDESPISGVTVQLLDQSGMTVDTTVTDEQGRYQFANLAVGQVYRVQPELLGDFRRGVSTFDMLLVRYHIIGANEFDDPFAYIAADVNNSQTITTLDIVQMRQLILWIDNTFANSPSWKFFRSTIVFDNPRNPFLGAANNDFTINLTEDVSDFDFLGVKIGDINHSALP